MVIRAAHFAYSWNVLFAEQQLPPLERLDPPRRAAVIMALLALVLLGLVLVTCIMIGGHWVRRMARHKPSARGNAGEAVTQNQRLRDVLQSVLPEEKTNDTIHQGKSPGETKID
jgi:hypothetical protein